MKARFSFLKINVQIIADKTPTPTPENANTIVS